MRSGEVHALCGENGAGKSTLMKILYGMQQPDEGTIRVDGADVAFRSPADAIRVGIGMVHQHFMLADNLTVAENVLLGAEAAHGIGARARARIAELGRTVGLRAEPGVLLERLGVADRQRVEILKVLYRGARTVILDEPTAVLVPQEVDELFATLRGMQAEGYTFLFISHKLDEVRAIADSITVIRRGTSVGTADPRTVTSRELAEMMVGSELPDPGHARVDGDGPGGAARRGPHARRRGGASAAGGRRSGGARGRGAGHRRRRGQRADGAGRDDHGDAARRGGPDRARRART